MNLLTLKSLFLAQVKKAEILPLFAETYGADQVRKWWVWWRLFFLACAELWGYRGGEEWVVSHYRFVKPVR